MARPEELEFDWGGLDPALAVKPPEETGGFLQGLADYGKAVVGDANALATGLLSGLTFGASTPLMDSLYGLATGSEARPYKALEQESPYVSAIGDMAGSMVSGTGLAKLGMKAAGAVAPESAGKVGSYLMSRGIPNAAARAGAAGGLGMVDSTLRSIGSEGELPSKGQLAASGLGGAVGQAVLGEGVRKIAGAVSGSSGFKRASDRLLKELEVKGGVGKDSDIVSDVDIDGIIAQRQALGDEATLIDASESAASMAKKLVSDRSILPHVPATARNYSAGGQDKIDKAYDDFVDTIYTTMPNSYKTNTLTGGVKVPRSTAAIAQAGRTNRQQLQQEFTKVFDDVTPELDPGFTSGGLKTRYAEYVDHYPEGEPGDKAIKHIMSLADKAAARSKANLTAAGLNQADYPVDYISPKEMLDLRKAVDRQIGTGMAGVNPDKGLVRDLYAMRDTISDDLVEYIPGFGRVNSRYANEYSAENAANLGYKVLASGDMNQKASADVLQYAMAKASPAEQASFMEGASRAIIEMVGKEGSDLATARKVMKSQQFRDKINTVFGDGTADTMLAAAEKAVSLTGTAKGLKGTSGTRVKQEAFAGFIESIRYAVIAGAAPKLVGKSSPISMAAGLGSTQAEVRRLGAKQPASIFRETDQILNAQGDQADTVLRRAYDVAKDPTISTSIVGQGRRMVGDMPPPSGNSQKDLLTNLLSRQLGLVPGAILGSATGSNMIGNGD